MDNLKSLIEALVFAADTPLRTEKLAALLEVERGQIQGLLEELVAEYQSGTRGFVLAEVAEGYQFRTRAEHAEWVRALLGAKTQRLSRAALETLAVVAYRQPITRAEIEYLRGVDSGGVLRTLLDRQLVRILGKKEIPGRPLIYGTSREFLSFFGLRGLDELPTLKDFEALAGGEHLS